MFLVLQMSSWSRLIPVLWTPFVLDNSVIGATDFPTTVMGMGMGSDVSNTKVFFGEVEYALPLLSLLTPVAPERKTYRRAHYLLSRCQFQFSVWKVLDPGPPVKNCVGPSL